MWNGFDHLRGNLAINHSFCKPHKSNCVCMQKESQIRFIIIIIHGYINIVCTCTDSLQVVALVTTKNRPPGEQLVAVHATPTHPTAHVKLWGQTMDKVLIRSFIYVPWYHATLYLAQYVVTFKTGPKPALIACKEIYTVINQYCEIRSTVCFCMSRGLMRKGHAPPFVRK